MIKFFRRIRQNLLNEGKTSKYFKYAIGEILLVVIGILIALQINNWNEQRKNKAKEKAILASIHKEFTKNKIQLDSVLFHHKKSYKACIRLSEKFPLIIENENLYAVVNTVY